MVSDVVISAVVGGLAGSVMGSTITAIAQIHTTNKQQDAETERRHAELYIGPKVETLTGLHATLDDCYRTIDDFNKRNKESVGREDYLGEVVPALEEYKLLLTRAGIYLSSDEKEKMDRALSQLQLAAHSIEHKAIADGSKPAKIDWVSLDAAYENARGVLRSQMSEPIENLES